MHKSNSIFPLLLLAFFLISPKAMANRTLADARLDQMAGAVMMLGFQGTQIDAALQKHLTQIQPGAIILFSRNIEDQFQLRNLNNNLVRLYHKPLIAVDQEGGQVIRIQTYPKLPSVASIGAAKSQKLAFAYGKDVGSTLRSLGINMNLAPVLDVATKGSFLANRSFSQDPSLAATLGRAFSEGLLSSGVIPTAKHFPGLGGFSADPHLVGRSFSTQTKAEILKRDLVPFAAFKDLFPSAMMLSHFAYPALDSLPAIYSKKISTDLLRHQYGYQGLVLTDDLLMAGAKSQGNVGKAAVKALKAGADLIMVSWSKKDQLLVHGEIKRSLRSGELPMGLMNEKLDRIHKVQNLVYHPNYIRTLPSLNRPELSLLNKQLSRIVIQKELAKMPLKNWQKISVVSSTRDSAVELSRSVARPIVYFPFNRTQQNISHLSRSELTIFLVKTALDRKIFAALSASILNKSIVLNLTAFPIQVNALAVINLYSPISSVMEQLGLILKDRLHAAYSPEREFRQASILEITAL